MSAPNATFPWRLLEVMCNYIEDLARLVEQLDPERLGRPPWSDGPIPRESIVVILGEAKAAIDAVR